MSGRGGSLGSPSLGTASTGAGGEVVQGGEDLARLPETRSFPAADLGDDAGVDELAQRPVDVGRGRAELGLGGGGIDDGSAEEQLGESPCGGVAPSVDHLAPAVAYHHRPRERAAVDREFHTARRR